VETAAFLQWVHVMPGPLTRIPVINRLELARDAILDNDIACAIADFKVIHVMDPSNALATDGLTLSRTFVAYPTDPGKSACLQPEAEWYPGLLFSPLMVIVGYFAWCIICGVMTRWYQVNGRRWLVVAGLMMPLAAIPPTNEVIRHLRNEHDRAKPPVVIYRDTDLREGNGPAYPLVAMLPRGAECRKIGERSHWLHIEFASGLTGWVWRSDALVGTDYR
jgi:hypothetical protein